MICTGITRLSCQVQLAPALRTRSESRKVGRGSDETFWGWTPANLPISDINEDAPQRAAHRELLQTPSPHRLLFRGVVYFGTPLSYYLHWHPTAVSERHSRCPTSSHLAVASKNRDPPLYRSVSSIAIARISASSYPANFLLVKSQQQIEDDLQKLHRRTS